MKFWSALKRIFVFRLVCVLGRRIERNHFTGIPILIVACPRSGTTLLLSILSAVPSIFAIPKQTYAFDRWDKKNNSWIPSRLDKLFRQFIYRRIPKVSTRWLEKTPGHVRSIEKILSFFKNRIKIIHIIRDGRDVTVSSHPAYLDRRKYWVPVERWVAEVKTGLAFQNHSAVHTLKYEDLIKDYQSEIKKILHFLEEPFPQQLENWTAHTKIKKSIHWTGQVQDVHSASIGKWRQPHHADRIRLFMENGEAVQLLKQLGYKV
ncbi:MAG TPA: sulfotransferase [Ohtaekwangia sp.]|nr:sulfotransferase [Ohtaekwangia sp.]